MNVIGREVQWPLRYHTLKSGSDVVYAYLKLSVSIYTSVQIDDYQQYLCYTYDHKFKLCLHVEIPVSIDTSILLDNLQLSHIQPQELVT